MRRSHAARDRSARRAVRRGRAAATTATRAALRTEFDVRAAARVRRRRRAPCTAHGVMRLATARDELVPLRDDRVRENPAYLTVVLLGRVITRLGTSPRMHAGHHREPVRLRPRVPAGPLPTDQPEGHTRAAVTCPRAATSSPSTSPVGAWGNRDVRGRPALRGGRVRRLPLPLAARRDPRPRARRAACGSSRRSPGSTPGSSGAGE